MQSANMYTHTRVFGPRARLSPFSVCCCDTPADVSQSGECLLVQHTLHIQAKHTQTAFAVARAVNAYARATRTRYAHVVYRLLLTQRDQKSGTEAITWLHTREGGIS